MTRADVAWRISELVGRQILDITDPHDGWPALATLRIDERTVPVALFVGPVGSSHRGRDDVERRYQNPGQNRPIIVPSGRLPLLLGLWDTDPHIDVRRPLLVAADPRRREGNVTRYSVFISVATLLTAAAKGWAEDTTASNEVMHAFLPPLLPLRAQVDIGDASLSETHLQVAVEAAGLAVDSNDALAAERVRRIGSSLVRDARFARRVLDAYGRLCAMCGLDLGLVEAAHIYPVAAPGSSDEPWNGIALCAIHHLAFDRHLLWVGPLSRDVRLHPEILRQRGTSMAVENLIMATAGRLTAPLDPAATPRAEMFEKRYRHFKDLYGWVSP